VRKVTQNIVGVLSLGVLATSWSLGQAAETGLSLAPGAAANTSDTAVNTDAEPTASPTATDAPTTAPTEAAGTAEATQSAASAAKSTPAPTKTATPTPTATTAKKASGAAQTGAAISYKFGVIQVEVVKSGSTITAVNLIQAGTKGPDWAVVPDMLAEAAVSANGSNFGNVSGATFTTQAFKQALESALAKF
jgi:uncharacterized protein with FMN-binding domain